MTTIRFSSDPYAMNWLRPDASYAEVQCPFPLTYKVTHEHHGDIYSTVIQITNTSTKPLITNREDISIALPLDTRYESTENCLTHRAHAHIFCGKNISWVMALRMGGAAPHLGLVLTQGSLDSYSVSHHGPLAHDRGILLLHPSAALYPAGETKVLSWTIFPHQGKEDFFQKLPQYSRYIHVTASNYVLFPGEEGKLSIIPSFSAHSVTVDGHPLTEKDGTFIYTWTAKGPGEHTFQIQVDDLSTHCRVCTHPSPLSLASVRTAFIANHQQWHGTPECLNGAYLAYDNEEEQMVYTPENDRNGGRERVGMGILMARYLAQGGKDPDGTLTQSLQNYSQYVLRELVDRDSGCVFNDIGRDLSYRRAYNAPWFCRFFLERFYWTGKHEDLQIAYRIACWFYEQEDGLHFYPIEMPLVALDHALCENDMLSEQARLRRYVVQHAQNLMQTGIHYPPQEVAFEQSIIGPAADVLLQTYEITGEEQYLRAAKTHIQLLDLFHGCQPDFHLYEVALRNWDGYWFGKRRLFGDTFPHYWSGITGNVYLRYARLTGNKEYAVRAEKILRGILPLIFADGRASCAYIYPLTSNGIKAECYDPYANDQDFGLYFALRAHIGSTSNSGWNRGCHQE